MILLGVGISIAVVVFVGFLVSKRIAGDSANFLVGGRMLPLVLVGGALMGSAVDTNATLGNTDLAAEFGFWAGACLPLGLALCLFLTGVFFAKPMNRMGLTSFPDYYRLRFGRAVEVAASVMLIVGLLHPGGRESGGGRLSVQLLRRYSVLAWRGNHRNSRGRLHRDRRTDRRRVYRDHPDDPCSGRCRRSADLDGRHARHRDRGRHGSARSGPDDRSRAGRHHQLGDADGARHRRHRRDRLHAKGFRREVPGDRAPGLLRRRDGRCGDLHPVRYRRPLGEGVPARGTRRSHPLRAARPVRARAADDHRVVRTCRRIHEHRQRCDPGDLERDCAQCRRGSTRACAGPARPAAVGDADRHGADDAARHPDRDLRQTDRDPAHPGLRSSAGLPGGAVHPRVGVASRAPPRRHSCRSSSVWPCAWCCSP